ncbi:MAG: hypothetical protein HY541_03420 [Deltaproteobacteria bacterium]|nr:hypothetical protein [Deltaproteobacteria bacterium]
MKQVSFCLTILVLFLFPIFSLRAENQCLVCHEQAAVRKNSVHDYAEWKGSPHASNNITCEMCHGGNAEEPSKAKAHAGIIPAGDPKSPLYFSNLPETCGKCHEGELKQFRKSYHYSELKRTGRGPNCATCHGVMATRILTPSELKETCSICHKERPIADEALVTLNLASQAVEKLKKGVDDARQKGKEVGPAENSLKALQKRLKELKVSWHSFNLPPLADEAKQLADTAREEVERLRLATGT